MERKNMKRTIAVAAATLCASMALLPARTVAQTADAWQFQAIIYGYFPRVDIKANFSGPAGINVSSDASVSASEIMQHLKMGFLGAFEARKGSWGAFTDLMYLNLGGLKSDPDKLRFNGVRVPVDASASASVDLKATVWTLAGTYRAVAKPDATLDVLAGARLLDVKETIGWELSGNIGPLPLPGRTGSSALSKSVWDAIIGVKGRLGFGADRTWFLPYYLDVGTGGTKLTWQGIGGVGYAFSFGELSLVWRYMDYKGKSGRPIENLSFNGPALGVSFHW